MIGNMGKGRLEATEWVLVRGRRRRWLQWFLLLPVLLFTFRVAQGIWDGWDWDVGVGMLVAVSLGLLFLAQLRPRTRATDEGLLIRGEFSREKLIAWRDVHDVDAEGGRWATAVTANLTDGTSVKLPGVAPRELESVKASRPGGATGPQR